MTVQFSTALAQTDDFEVTPRAVALAIAPSRALSEETFLTAGRDLEQAVTVLRHLTGSFAALLTDLEGEDVELATRDIGQAASTIATFSGAFDEESRTLQALTAVTADIHHRVQRMVQAVKAADALGVNAKIEARHLSEISLDFKGFADEIDRSLKRAQSNLSRLRDEVSAMLEHLHDANREERAFGDQYAETLKIIPRRLAASMDTLGARHDQAVASAGAVADCSERIARRISEAVMALQIGDITRQRIEHVEEAIGLLETIEGGADDWQALDQAARDGLLALGYRLQSDQLAATAEELQREAGRILASLGEIRDSTAEITGLGVDTYGGSDVSQGTFLAELEGDLEQARALLQGFVTARARADGIVGTVGEAANRLLDQIGEIRSLEVDIRITGLNASFKCRRVGDAGLPLSIIAQELRACALSTAEEADGIVTSLDAMKRHLATLSESRRSERASEIATVSNALTASVGRIGGAGRDLATALGGLKTDSGRVTGFLRDASGRLSADTRITAALRQASADMAAMAAARLAAPPLNDAAFEAARARLLERFAASYTMAQERDVHASITGDGPAMPKATDDSTLDDFLF
jgi:hypothetical protein